MTAPTERVAHLRCPRCKATRKVRESDVGAHRGHHCTCGSMAPMLLRRVTVERVREKADTR